MHDNCNEICPLTACQMASPLCIADADTRFAVYRHDRAGEKAAERREAANRFAQWREIEGRAAEARERGPMAFAQFVRVERAKLGLKKYDKRRKFAKVL